MLFKNLMCRKLFGDSQNTVFKVKIKREKVIIRSQFKYGLKILNKFYSIQYFTEKKCEIAQLKYQRMNQEAYQN